MAAREIFFLGGGRHRELGAIYEIMARHIKQTDRVLMIPFATEESEYDRWYDHVSQAFSAVGINNISLLHFRETEETMIRQIQSSHALYFTGGLPDVLLKRLEQKNLMEAIKSYSGILIGFSAGALAFCKDCIITEDEDYPETLIVNGLGIADFSVEVHYKTANDEILHRLSNGRTILAIPNGSAVHWNGFSITPIQTVFRFNRGQKTELF